MGKTIEVGVSLAGAALILTTTTAPSAARGEQDPVSKPTVALWNGFTTATPKPELKAFIKSLPKGRYALYPGCDPHVGYRYIKGRLVTITLVGTEQGGACTRRILADMTAVHGDPQVGSGVQAAFSGVAGRYGTVGHDDFTWKLPGKRIALYIVPGSPASYTLAFTVRRDEFLY